MTSHGVSSASSYFAATGRISFWAKSCAQVRNSLRSSGNSSEKAMRPVTLGRGGFGGHRRRPGHPREENGACETRDRGENEGRAEVEGVDERADDPRATADAEVDE